ncbi:Erg28-like protein [Gigaspora margarita]|uniref:Erg28-like protein n=1 Tax=Gigaspora margarita TaxID=4874 RepID=A0A8H3X958_GIGMA|nr:Erg28-like protein [Gigaspora margarita]
MSNYLPQASGYLPYWTLFVSVVAVFNTIQNLLTVSITKQIYSAKPEQVTELSARLFAVWTFTSGVIRFYAAYNLNNKTIYHITIWTYVIAFFYFSSELLYFKSAKIGPGVLSPIVVSSFTLTWMVSQYNYYVKNEKERK